MKMKSVRTAVLLLGLMIAGPSTAGRVDTVKVHDVAMNRDVEVVIVSPERADGYLPARYPVVYLLHGAGDNARAWVSHKKDLPRIADEKGMIFVTPDALRSWYFDSPVRSDMRFETFVSRTLVTYVDTYYPTKAHRSARAITGLSMGGHGALFLAMRHPDVFGAAGSMSGGVDIRPFPTGWELPNVLGEMEKNREVWDSHTVINQTHRIKNGDLAITIDCGYDDFFFEVNNNLHRKLLDSGIAHDYINRPGGHSWDYWCDAIDFQLVFFDKFFRRNAAGKNGQAQH